MRQVPEDEVSFTNSVVSRRKNRWMVSIFEVYHKDYIYIYEKLMLTIKL